MNWQAKLNTKAKLTKHKTYDRNTLDMKNIGVQEKLENNNEIDEYKGI